LVHGTGPLGGTATDGCAAADERGVSSGRMRSVVVPGADETENGSRAAVRVDGAAVPVVALSGEGAPSAAGVTVSGSGAPGGTARDAAVGAVGPGAVAIGAVASAAGVPDAVPAGAAPWGAAVIGAGVADAGAAGAALPLPGPGLVAPVADAVASRPLDGPPFGAEPPGTLTAAADGGTVATERFAAGTGVGGAPAVPAVATTRPITVTDEAIATQRRRQ
jgi:hypothetical protein